MKIKNPIIELIPDNRKSLQTFSKKLDSKINDNKTELIKNYPVVYIHHWKKNDKYEVYVGESNDFFRRTEQHYDAMKKNNTWQYKLKKNNANLFVIAHKDFNKSFTMDVENKLIHYLSSSSSVNKVHNARGNPQNKYFPCEEFNEVFAKIWKQLRLFNKDLFLLECEIKDSSIYKSSPLHKLNDEQLLAKDLILKCIHECLLKDKKIN